MSEVITLADGDTVAQSVARALRERVIGLLAVESERNMQICLTGGGIANRMYRQFAGQQTEQIDWTRVEFWWGDERYVPTEDPDRNAGQTLAILAGTIALDAAKVHPMPSADGSADLSQAAMQYAEELGETRFDVCLLGMGPDGHVASIFPGHPSFETPSSSTVIAVRNAPKPPPSRLSITIPVINSATEVWLLVSGAEKAAAVRRALNGDPSLPAAQVCGAQRTMWWLDQPAASLIGK